VFASLDVLAVVAGTIWPGLDTLPVLFVLLPLSLVLCAIKMAVFSKAMSLVILPVTIIYISVCVNQSSLVVGLVVLPVALVHGAVWPDLGSLALSDVVADQPLALVSGLVLEDAGSTSLDLAEGLLKVQLIIDKLTQFLSHVLYINIVMVIYGSWCISMRMERLISDLLYSSSRKETSDSRLDPHEKPDHLWRVGLPSKSDWLGDLLTL